MPDLTLIATVTIFIATYAVVAVVAVGKVPVYRIDRAGAALLGGSLMLGIGVLTPQEAYRAIDFDTITLLLGMMIVVINLRVCGFFRLVTDWIATHVRPCRQPSPAISPSSAPSPISSLLSGRRRAASTSASGLISGSAHH
jgi:di/tricarboxylate transporter